MNEDKASRYHRLKRRATVAAVVADAALLVTLLASGGAARLRDVAVAAAGAEPDAAAPVAIYVALLAAIHTLIALPLAYYDGYTLERRFGLSRESRREFLHDHAKAVILNIALALIAAELVYAAMRVWPDAWWIASSTAMVGGLAILAALAPVIAAAAVLSLPAARSPRAA